MNKLMIGDAELARLYEFCRPEPEVYSLLRRLVSYGTQPDVPSPMGDGGRSYAERLVDAAATVPGDVWFHRKNGRKLTILETDGRNVKVRHQLGKVTMKWYSYLASDFDKQSSTPAERPEG